MRRTAAILGSCLKLLALVDAITLSKLRFSKYNVEQVESDWLPYDQRSNFLESSPPFILNSLPALPSTSNVRRVTQVTSFDDFSPYAELPFNSPSQNLVPPNPAFDNWQRKPTDEPYILKLKLKIKLAKSDPKYETVVDEKYTPAFSSLDPSYDKIDYVARYPLESVTDGILDESYHSGKSHTPNGVEEIAKPNSRATESVDGLIKQSEALLDDVNEYLQLRDLVSKLMENSTHNDNDQSTSEAVRQSSELLGDQNTTPEVESVTDEKLEESNHSGKSHTPNKTDIAKPNLHDSESVDDIIKQSEDLLDDVKEYLQLRDLVSKLMENSARTNHDQSTSEAIEQSSELLGDQNATPEAELDHSVRAYDRIHHFSSNVPSPVEKEGRSDGFERKDNRRFEKLHHSQRPIPYTPQKEENGDERLHENTRFHELSHSRRPVPYTTQEELNRDGHLRDNTRFHELSHSQRPVPYRPQKEENGDERLHENTRFHELSHSRRPVPYTPQEMTNEDESWQVEFPYPKEFESKDNTRFHELPHSQRPIPYTTLKEENGDGHLRDNTRYHELSHSLRPVPYTTQEIKNEDRSWHVDLLDPSNFKNIDVERSEEKYHAQRPSTFDDSIVSQPVGFEKSFPISSQIDAKSSEPADFSNKPSNRATQTEPIKSNVQVPDDYWKKQNEYGAYTEPPPTPRNIEEPYMRDSSSESQTEPIKSNVQVPDDYWKKQNEYGAYTEPPPTPRNIEEPYMRDSSSESKPSGLASNNGQEYNKEDNNPSLFSRFWSKYGW